MLKQENQITAVHIADIHWKALSSTKLYNELKNVFIKYITEHSDKIDIIFIHGDLFDSKVSLTEQASIYCMKFIYQLLLLCKKKNISVRMIKGTKTHDFNQLDNFKPYEKQFKNFKIYNVVDEEDYEGVKILYVPEEYMNDQDAYYEEYKSNEYNYIIGHGTWDVFAFASQIQESERPIKGSPVFKYNEWEDTVKDNGLIIFGHIHVKNDYKKLHYVGSYSRWCYGEENPKGFLVSNINLKTKKQKLEFIENPLAQEYTTIKLSESVDNDNLEATIKDIEKLSNENSKNYRIKVDTDISLDNLKILRESFSDTSNIKIELQSIKDKIEDKENKEEYDFLSSNDPDENIRMYIQNKFNYDITKEEILEITTPEE